MTEECEIEYLDEDAEIVQQCVQPPNSSISSSSTSKQTTNYVSLLQQRGLLVEREIERKRKRKKDEEDSDYDPSEDLHALDSAKKKKRPVVPIRKVGRKSILPLNTFITNTGKKAIAIDDIRARKKLDIRIPDYDDPLCLPVRAIINSNNDLQKVRHWNNMCLEHFKNASGVQRPEKAKTKSSARTVVLRNVVHKETGKQETAVWSKVCVEDKAGVKKSEIFQSILPKFREKKILKSYSVAKHVTKFRHVNETILTKEDHKDGNVLVVYKPREKTTAVYKFVTDPNKSLSEDEPKKSLKETVICKCCAPCYQTSWRGSKKTEETPISCPVCGRASVSVYNLLTHLRVHPSSDVRAHSEDLSAKLAKVLDYHYKCRICQEQFLSIKRLRQHVATHTGVETFKCEVGNHITK
ncbi:hypothetical protein ABMA28_010021 [Loxostege sticticalis]|uniref:C2H2-type domain-containing protein n=1 Tax=Loxostege sticticalis TaxID=481309 RepID=A0ABD0SA02_LOXSC